MTTKKSQHFVPRFYLEQWTKNGLIAVKNGSGIFVSNILNIAQENYFYEYPLIDNEKFILLINMLKHIKMPLVLISEHLKSTAFPRFLYAAISKKISEKEFTNILTTGLSNGIWDKNFVEYNSLLVTLLIKYMSEDEISNNPLAKIIKEGEEDCNSKVENMFLPIYKKILSGGTSVLCDNNNFDIATFYMIHQLFRTLKFLRFYPKLLPGLDEKKALMANSIKPYLRLPYVTMVQASILANMNSYSLSLIDNDTTKNFITADQPIVNICEQDDELYPRFFDLFFPLSPKKALFLTKKERKSNFNLTSNITSNDVVSLNSKIMNNCVKMIYASSKEELVSIADL